MTGAPSDLVERLGHAPGTRAIILNADDFGMCRGANTAIVELMEAGRIDSATVMVPCAWSPAALAYAAASTAADIGVHLVLTSEWSAYRWRPLTGVGSTLVDEAGFFPSDVATVEKQASNEDVARELEAQIVTALAAGVDVTHLDNHMGSVYGLETGRDFLGETLTLAARYRLPFRLPRTIEGMGLPARHQGMLDQATAVADALGVVLPDRLWTHPFPLAGEGTDEEESYEDVRDAFFALLRRVGAGVTEIFLHPMADDAELRATVDFAAKKRGYEHRLLADPLLDEVLAEEGIVRVAWRQLRDLQRAGESGL